MSVGILRRAGSQVNALSQQSRSKVEMSAFMDGWGVRGNGAYRLEPARTGAIEGAARGKAKAFDAGGGRRAAEGDRPPGAAPRACALRRHRGLVALRQRFICHIFPGCICSRHFSDTMSVWPRTWKRCKRNSKTLC